jgi:hypothetical protein
MRLDNQYERQWHQFRMEYGNVTKEEMPNLLMAILDLFQSPVNNFIEPSGGDRMAMTS